jgi:hypothetical protein
MATPKERSDERERARAAKKSTDAESTHADVAAQQQGDGQPENAREIEDHSSGSAQADDVAT